MHVAHDQEPVCAAKTRETRVTLRRDENYLIHDMRPAAPCLAPPRC
ncbi:hypothetical protein C8D77_105342 [Mesorhizobium loti]|uniref:Uncharacterized protein n=1 Tax=Rhizobium loti TaxID=381 RepID=A0A8E2WBQ0_RHILI|nr:hypothetical protein C8D77_105342 [Mesorhizobium loti]